MVYIILPRFCFILLLISVWNFIITKVHVHKLSCTNTSLGTCLIILKQKICRFSWKWTLICLVKWGPKKLIMVNHIILAFVYNVFNIRIKKNGGLLFYLMKINSKIAKWRHVIIQVVFTMQHTIFFSQHLARDVGIVYYIKNSLWIVNRVVDDTYCIYFLMIFKVKTLCFCYCVIFYLIGFRLQLIYNFREFCMITNNTNPLLVFLIGFI